MSNFLTSTIYQKKSNQENNPISRARPYIEKNMREDLNDPNYQLTDEEYAKMLDMPVLQLRDLEAHPEKVSFPMLKTLSELSGLTLDALSGQEKCSGPRIVSKSDDLRQKISAKEDEAQASLKRLQNLEIISTKKFTQFEEERKKLEQELKDIISVIKAGKRRLRVVAYGESDSGKSTLGNFFLNEEVFPEQYQPMTGIIAICHYIDEKPSYLSDSENAVVIGTNGKNQKMTVDSLDLDVIEEKNILQKGDYHNILADYGAKTGSRYQQDRAAISCIHVFLDNPNLKDMTFYDVPGFSSGDIADDVAMKLDPASFDVFFYLSQATGFLNGDELTKVTNLMYRHQNFDTFFIVATHADDVKDPNEAKEICKRGATRIRDATSDQWLRELQINPDDLSDLSKHILLSDVYNKRYCFKLNTKMESIIPELEYSRLQYNYEKVCRACRERSAVFQSHGAQIEQKIKLANSIDEDTARRQREASSAKIVRIQNNLYSKIDDYRRSSIRKFNDRYDEIIDADHIEQQLKDKNVKNNKSALEDYCTFLGNQIQDAMSESVKEENKKFSEDVNRAIKEYSDIWMQNSISGINFTETTGMDFTTAFAGGLNGLSTIGALGAWGASVVADGSNIGAYLLVTTAVSALAAVGITAGGTAASTFVSAIGGPVVLGITIAVIAVIAVLGIRTGTWRKRVAKKIVEQYEKGDTRGKAKNNLDKYWNDTKDALKSCLAAMQQQAEDEYTKFVNMKHQENNNDLKNGLKKLYQDAAKIFQDLAME